ncbi:hypothetical protein NMG60_11023427 [Bertholletia excelsa]
MVPTRKSRSTSEHFSSANEIFSTKDMDNSKKSLQRKRNLSGMLGSRWSKQELEYFYEAYRKHGKDWKKVAAALQNRSVEMVEALYTMNRAYLSLPEGTASVVGLIAMMTDYYCNLEGSDHEQESNDGIGSSPKFQKCSRTKYHASSSKGYPRPYLSHSQPVASSSGCLSLLKRQSVGNQPRAVGKRTPRYPVSYSFMKVKEEKFFSLAKQGLKTKADANDDGVAHKVALALSDASQRGASPQDSQTPNRRIGNVMPLPVLGGERMHAELELSSAKLGSEMDEDGFEGSLKCTEADNGNFARTRKYFEAVGAPEVEKLVTEEKVAMCCSHVLKKQSKKKMINYRSRDFGIFHFTDKESSFDALQALADLSLMMPATYIENESSRKVQEEVDNLVSNYGVITHQTGQPEFSGVKTKGNHLLSGSGTAALKISNLGKILADVGAVPDAEAPQQSTRRISRKKQKLLSEAVDVGKKLTSKGKHTYYNASEKKQEKSVGHTEHASSSSDVTGKKKGSALSTVQVPVVNQVYLPTKARSRRKMDQQKLQNLNNLKLSYKISNGCQPNAPIQSVHDGAQILKEKFSNCLSNKLLRRWCVFEWFYSAIDYPWFARREFVEYLNHVGLGHGLRLTLVEWSVIRSSLGKPRRFSEQLLKEEKEKLNIYRESVRTHYSELRAGIREGLLTDLARPLSVGQRVIAIHPKTREIHDGNVLTVDHARCRVQFEHPNLGVEFVPDIDCMTLNVAENVAENMPASLARNTITIDKFFGNSNELKMNGWAKDQKLQAKGAPKNPKSQAQIGHKETVSNRQSQNSQPSLLAQIWAKEADVQALAELTRALDKKEAVLSELKHMNHALENPRDGDSALRDSDPFKKQYAAVVIQLNEVNEQVASALCCLRQRNTYQGSGPVACSRISVIPRDSSGPLSLFNHQENNLQESGAHVHEIVESSKTKARTMVNAATQAMSSLKGGGNPDKRIEEAIDYISNQFSVDDACVVAFRPITPANLTHGLLNDPGSLHAPETELKNRLDKNEKQIPSELISHCVATLFMIQQKCTERQIPPADVAQILDSAVISLQPGCPQNLPIYADIQKCMGIIRNQILALIPT